MAGIDPLATTLSEGVLTRLAQVRQWHGVTAEAVEWRSTGRSRFELTSARWRAGFVLEQIGGQCETRANLHVSQGYSRGARPFLTLTPPGTPVWACSENIPYTRSVSLSFDAATLLDRMGEELGGAPEAEPHFNIEHARLCALAGLLAAEIRDPGPFGELYSDSLITAMLVELIRFDRTRPLSLRRHRLATWQLRQAIDYMEAHTGRSLTLHDLGHVTGLSPAYFARAFKASTGVPPYQWHLNTRIQKAQRLLLEGRLSIARVAADTGFADQAHFTRAFTRIVGASPAAWQRDRRS